MSVCMMYSVAVGKSTLYSETEVAGCAYVCMCVGVNINTVIQPTYGSIIQLNYDWLHALIFFSFFDFSRF